VIETAAALELSRVTKRFGRTVAVDDSTLAVPRGTVHALLGENGAGKTTLMRLAFGMIRPDEGTIAVNGTRRTFSTPADAIGAGIGMVHQHFTNVPAMTVAENVALGGSGTFSRKRVGERVREISQTTGLVLDPDALVSELSVGAQQRLEIVKALARNASILILDEPTAVLAPAEATDLLRWLREFANQGNAVVLVTHKLREAIAIADDVTVMRRGKVVLSVSKSDVDEQLLSHAIIGEGATTPTATALPAAHGNVIASMDSVTVVDGRGAVTLRECSVSLRRGELLGVAGVDGAGQRELLRVLAGRVAPNSGSVMLPTQIAFVPEDRHADALILEFSQLENVALRGVGQRSGLMRWPAQRSLTTDLVNAFDVRGGAPDEPVRALSGGNQQKLVLARELSVGPAVVVAENPTRGLDIRATSEVHRRLRDAAASGAAVVLYSSDLDEILALATRVLVMHAGEAHESSLDREAIGRAMLGAA
jgi:simple sugar transport system ATP-binding protein